MARASAEDENLAYVTLASYDLSDNMTSMNSTALGIDSESEQQQSWPGFPWLWREAGPYKQKQFVFSIPESPPNPAQAECDEGVALLTKYEFYDIKPNATGKFKISTISTWDKTSKVLDNDVNEIGEILVCQDWQTYWPQRNLVPVYYEITIGGRKYRAMGAGTSPNFPQFDVLPGGLQAMTREGYPEVGVTYLSITATVLPSTEGKVGGMFFTGNLAYVDGVDRDYYDHGGIGVLQILVPHHEL